jgi:oligopeptide/dipeptide ABC transporter ATP-binding protein
MYLGRIVEQGPTEKIFREPKHWYTKALLEAAPTLDKLLHLPEELPGELPDPRTKFAGCRFASRCPNAKAFCADNDPGRTDEDDRSFWCHFPSQGQIPVREI